MIIYEPITYNNLIRGFIFYSSHTGRRNNPFVTFFPPNVLITEMKRILLILLTAVALPGHPAADQLFPFDTLNVPDELLSDAPGDVYFTGGFYYLDDSGESELDDIGPQSYWYYFMPLNVGYQFWRGFTAGVQVTLLNREYGDAVLDDYGDVWLKAKYSKRVNRFFIGGRIAGKFGKIESFSSFNEEDAETLDLTFFGGAELTKSFSAEFTAGYRFIGKTKTSYDDMGNVLHASGSPTLSLWDGVFTAGLPVSYYRQSTFLELSDEHGRIFYGEMKHRTVSVGPKAAYTFGDRFPSSVTFRADFVIAAENVALDIALLYPRDYYVGGGYSVIAPF